MTTEPNDTQPSASSAASDFNDLHLMQGIEAVAKQIHSAIDLLQASPTPPVKADCHLGGQGSEFAPESVISIDQTDSALDMAENALAVESGAGGGISPRNTKGNAAKQKDPINCIDQSRLLSYTKRYKLIEGKTDIWDCDTKTSLKKNAFVAAITKQYYDEWLLVKDIISKIDLNAEIDQVTLGSIQELIDNFVLLEGSETVWNFQRNKRWSLKALKAAYPNMYDLWHKSPHRRQIDEENLVFDPTGKHDQDPNYVNTYQGFPIKPLLDDDGNELHGLKAKERCINILKFARVLCGDDASFQWLLKWLAYPLQHAGAKMQTCVLMHGHIQGAGKSLFFGKIIKAMYGNYFAEVGQSQMDSDFNSWMESKLFALFEEIADNKKKHNIMGMLKHLITGDTVYVNPKNMNAWKQVNHMNTVFLSNNTQPLPLEEHDRRFLVLYPDVKLDKTLLDHVLAEQNADGIQALYTFLTQLPLGDFNTHTEPPMTKAKMDLIAYSRPGYDTFYHAWMASELNWPYATCKSTQLYDAFCSWCKKSGEHVISMRRFIGEGKKHGIVPTDKPKHWKYMQRKGQNTMILIGKPPEGTNEMDWLGRCINDFEQGFDKSTEVSNYVA